jgi:SLOG in TRPM, prokaryote
VRQPGQRPTTTSPTAGPVPIAVSAENDLLLKIIDAGIPVEVPVVVLVGGASGLDREFFDVAQRAIAEVVVPVAAATQAVIVDGGTDSGVMGLVGRCHVATGAGGPLVGVAVQALVRWPVGTAKADAEEAQDAEPHHGYLILVPGQRWGDESRWLSAVAQVLSAGMPSATVVVNGGPIALQDVVRSLRALRPVVALEGTGRTADDLAAVVRGRTEGAEDHPEDVWITIREGAAAGLVTALDPDAPLAQRRAHLQALIT